VAPLRLIHFADLHLGVETHGRIDPATGLNTRLADQTARLDEVVDAAIAEGVDLVLFAGDAFRSRDPSPTLQREFARRMRRLSEAGIPTVLLAGNHDLPAASGRADSLDIYATLGVAHLTVVRTPRNLTIETSVGPVQIIALPWLRRSALLSDERYQGLAGADIARALQDSAAEYIVAAAAECDPRIPTILLGHLSVDGAMYGSERAVMIGDDIVLPRSSLAIAPIGYVALGHIHKHQVIGHDPPIAYPGSLERVDFGEETDQKGYIVATLDGTRTQVEFRPVQARAFRTILSRPVSSEPTVEIERSIAATDITDAIVRLIVEISPDLDALVDWARVRVALRPASNAVIRRDVARRARSALTDDVIASLSVGDALERYLTTQAVAPERRALLQEHARQLIETQRADAT
jgi:exonuclease SbcD